MKTLNNYIHEAWNGVKKQTSIDVEIKSWCEEMGIEKYTINSQGEIDVDWRVNLRNKEFEELPYKFGTITGYFDIGNNPNLTSLKNCPDFVKGSFSCSLCPQLDSLEGCPKEFNGNFCCYGCKREFTIGDVKSLCKVKMYIWR